MGRWQLLVAVAVGLAGGCGEERPGPVKVAPADGAGADGGQGGAGAGSGEGKAIWVVDADGQELGVLFRRGSDDNVANRAYFDFVTVFHPESGLFFEVTMSDALVRYPGDVFFQDAFCGEPVGLSVGGCQECRSGPGTGFLHEGAWWRVVAGVTYQQTPNNSVRGSGLTTTCVVHGTSNSKAFPVEAVEGAAPPVSLKAPLSFSWR